MSCKIEKANNGLINNILDTSGKTSLLFRQILNTPTLSLQEAIDVYRNIYSSKLKDKVVDGVEPNLIYISPSGETFTNYQEVLQATDYGKIKLNIDDVTIAEVDSDTNVNNFNGVINHFVKQGGLTGERILDVNGDIIYVTQGKTEDRKHITSELLEKQTHKLLGLSGVRILKTGDFIFTDTLNKITINDKVYGKKEIDELDYEQLEKKFGREKALEIELGREYVRALQPTQTKKRLEETPEVKTEDELTVAIKSLLNKMGVKITYIEDYIKHNTLKNNDVAPEASALMDVVNKIMAFRDGTITREDLIEETMHLIEATLDPALTEGVRRNISKTPEWRQYSEQYRQIYAKEYSGDRLDEMVRREILGKVMANAVINNFAQTETTSLVEQSIFERIREFLQQFFDKINAYFKPEYQQQIDALNNDIYAKLMQGSLINELNTDQNYGTKFRLYSTSTSPANEIVRLQQEAEKALNILKNNISQLGKEDPSQNYQVKAARALLKNVEDAQKKGDDTLSRVEAIATFAKIVNMVQRQTKYLERASKKATQNRHPFSAEERIVYNSLVNDFSKNILPVISGYLEKKTVTTKAEKRILQELEKTNSDINKLIGAVQNSGFIASDYVVDLLVSRLSLDKQAEDFLRERAKGLQEETNWFFMQFGNLSHSSNVYLNALGHVITKTDGDKRQGFQKDIKPFIDKLSKLNFLKGKGLSGLVDGDYLQSVHQMNAIEKARAEKEYNLYYELLERQEGVRPTRIDFEKFEKEDVLNNLNADYSQQFSEAMEEWEINEYSLRPLKKEFSDARKEALKKYNPAVAKYQRMVNARYGAIMQEANVVDGIPLVTQEMRYDIEAMKKLREDDKSLTDIDGELKSGISIAQQDTEGAVRIGDNLYVALSENARSEAILAVGLSQLDYDRIQENKGKEKASLQDSAKFIEMLSKMEAEEAYDFLMLNAYVGYSQEYYDTLNRTSLADKLEENIDEENEYEVRQLIDKITQATTRVNTILRANKMLNNPAEVQFDSMGYAEVATVKELQQRLENLYSQARKYLPKQERREEEESLSETIPNQAFRNYMFDAENISQLQFEGILEEDQLRNINKIFNVIASNTTENRKQEISDLRSDLKRFKEFGVKKLSNINKRAFKLSEQEYNEMGEEERFTYMTNELLKYSFTKLHPYFRKSPPIGIDRTLEELRAGILSTEEFLNNYSEGKYQYLNITPNYNFQEATDVNNKNPHFQNAKINATPLIRVFEDSTTLQDVQTKTVDQLLKEGKLNKFTNKEFLKEYNIDLVELFQTGREVARTNLDKFEARQALIDLQKISLDKNKMLGKHNLYLLPQKEASKTRKFDDFLKSGKSLRSVAEEMFNFREDEAELGQDENGKAITQSSDASYKIPKFGLRRLRDAPVTTDLLESYVWMNYKANEHLARRENVGDAINIMDALQASEFEGNIEIKSSRVYKTYKESMESTFYNIKESSSKQFKVLGFPIDQAKLLRNFGYLIRLRNLGFTVISPITSATTGSIFLRIESLVGQNVDRDALSKANNFFRKYAGSAAREIMGLESKSTLNALGELYGWYDANERYNNTMYSKTLRGIQATAFGAHSLANFPINTRVGLAVLANNRFVEGEMIEYRTFAQRSKGKSEKEIRAQWENYTSVLDVVETKPNGEITYNYAKIAESLNNNFTVEEAEKFMQEKSIVIRGRIKAAIQVIDGQIAPEDKSMSTRNSFFSFMNIHRSWLMIAVQNKTKKRQLNTSTGYIETGTWRAVGGLISDIVKEARSKGAIQTLKRVRAEWKDYDIVTKQAVSRTLWESGILTGLIGLTLLGLRELSDDDEDSWMFKVGALFTFRTTSELASSTVALPQNVFDTLENVIVGISTLDVATDFGDLFSSDIVERGRYRGLTDRERYFYKNLPIFRDYNNMFKDIEGSIKSYNYFNFVKNNTLEWSPSYYVLDSIINEDEE